MQHHAYALYAMLSFLAGAPGSEPAIQVQVASLHQEYVLGYPVRLTVTVTNHGQREVLTWTDSLRDQVELLIAGNGDGFRRFSEYRLGTGPSSPTVERLLPGRSKVYEYRVLYGRVGEYRPQTPLRLAFDRPGVYTVKAVYPVPSREQKKIE